ncbi:MAG: sensor histidine kinase [Xanthobacteraceae bacterium]|nr:sensor histidine kinase [Xanthobacteraceae bacterium]
MKSDQTRGLRTFVAQCVLGGIGLALITAVCFALKLDFATVSFCYLMLIALLSMMGSFAASVVLPVIAVVCLNYFFVEPLFQIRFHEVQEPVGLAAFLTTSLIVTTLTFRVRRNAQALVAAQAAMIDSIPGMVWSAHADGSRAVANRRWSEFTGLQHIEIGAESSVYHPDDRDNVVKRWRHSVVSGESFEVEARMRSANGDFRAFLIRAEPVRDQSGRIVRWYGLSTDVEDRRRAMEDLRAREREWREVFEHNPAMYFMLDPSGTVLSLNAFGAAQLGYTAAELIGQSVLKVFLKSDWHTINGRVAKCLQQLGQSHNWEACKVRKDGTRLWVRETAKAVQRPGNQIIILVACEDITERKRAEDALRQSQMQLAEAQELSHTGSFSWEMKTGALVWSDELFRIFELDRAEKPSVELVLQRTHPDDRAGLRHVLTQVERERTAWEYEHRLMIDGRIKHVRVVAHASTTTGDESWFVGAVMDRTAAWNAEQELQQAQNELARVSRVTTLGELTAAIAHEINQPLTGLVSSGSACLRWLASDPPDLDSARRAVERMTKDGTRAGEVIGRIRSLVKKAPPRRDWLNINDVVTEVLALIGTELQRNGVLILTELSNDVPCAFGDRVQLQQVVLNLIMNANDAMADGPRQLLIRSENKEADEVRLSVCDTGVGLDGVNVDALFEAFYTTKRDGMGMGLAVSRSLIEAHGGRLWAAPNTPRGAVFQFSLPVGGERA